MMGLGRREYHPPGNGQISCDVSPYIWPTGQGAFCKAAVARGPGPGARVACAFGDRLAWPPGLRAASSQLRLNQLPRFDVQGRAGHLYPRCRGDTR